MQKKLVIFGSFGFGNVGDEAVPLAIQDIFAGVHMDRQLKVVSRFAKPVLDGVLGLDETYRQQLKSLSNKPVVLSGGGIIEPSNSCCLMKFEKYRRFVQPNKMSILAGSFEYGVHYSWQIKRKLSRLLNVVDKIYTRDYISEIFFRENFPDFPVSTIGDVVLGLSPISGSRNAHQNLLPNEYIAVSLCPKWADDSAWYPWIVNELYSLSANLDKQIVFVPMTQHFDYDRNEHRLVADQLMKKDVKHKPVLIEKALSPREVANIFKNAYLATSMRLHGCVLAYAQKTPFVGLSYHPKLLGFAQTTGWRQFMLPKCSRLKQDKSRYGYAFDSSKFTKNDLLEASCNALEFGDFSLLPLFKKNLSDAFRNTI